MAWSDRDPPSSASQLLAAEGEPGERQEADDQQDRCGDRPEGIGRGRSESHGPRRLAESDWQIVGKRWRDAEDPDEDEGGDAQAGRDDGRAA
jgi:hypothetical protein